MAAPTMNTERMESALERAADLYGRLGYSVYWRVPRDLLIPTDKLRELLTACEISLLIPDIRDKGAVSKALRALKERGLIRQVPSKDDRLIYTLTRVNGDKEREALTFREGYRVAFYYDGVPAELQVLQPDPELPVIYIADDGNHAEAARRIRPLIDQYKSCYTARDITERIFLPLLASADYWSPSSQGGFYDIPANEIGTRVIGQLKALAAAITDATGEAVSVRFRSIAAVPEEAEEIGGAILDSLTGEMDKLAGDLAQLEGRADKVQNDTLLRQRNRIEAVLAKAGRLSQIGTFQIETLNTAAAELMERVRTMEKPADAPAPKRQRRKTAGDTAAAAEPIGHRQGRLDDVLATAEAAKAAVHAGRKKRGDL